VLDAVVRRRCCAALKRVSCPAITVDSTPDGSARALTNIPSISDGSNPIQSRSGHEENILTRRRGRSASIRTRRSGTVKSMLTGPEPQRLTNEDGRFLSQ